MEEKEKEEENTGNGGESDVSNSKTSWALYYNLSLWRVRLMFI
jgi:hypothetical protein